MANWESLTLNMKWELCAVHYTAPKPSVRDSLVLESISPSFLSKICLWTNFSSQSWSGLFFLSLSQFSSASFTIYVLSLFMLMEQRDGCVFTQTLLFPPEQSGKLTSQPPEPWEPLTEPRPMECGGGGGQDFADCRECGPPSRSPIQPLPHCDTGETQTFLVLLQWDLRTALRLFHRPRLEILTLKNSWLLSLQWLKV